MPGLGRSGFLQVVEADGWLEQEVGSEAPGPSALALVAELGSEAAGAGHDAPSKRFEWPSSALKEHLSRPRRLYS